MAPLESSDPSRIGPYVLKSRLGSGGTGIVYEAERDDGLSVALKVIRNELSDLPQIRERLRREADSLQRVTSTRCAEVYEVNADAHPPYLAMELISGRDISAEIFDKGPLRGAMARAVFISLVEALEAIHSAGIIHRDLKPSNVLMGEMGVRVVDFGISAILDAAQLTSTGLVVGTASWMSPEQIDGRDLTTSTDVFNLGLVMSFCLTGKHPFGEGRPDALMYRIMHSDPDLSAIPGEYRTIIEGCLSKNPSVRVTLARVGELLRIASGSGEAVSDSGTTALSPGDVVRAVAASRESTPAAQASLDGEKSRLIRQRRKPLLLAIGCVAIAGLVGAVLSFGGASSTPESKSATTSLSPTTTIAVTPVFKIFRENGVGYRWDPCGGVINVGVNYGALTGASRESAVSAINQAILEVSEISGLPFVYAGESASTPRDKYRNGRNGSQALLVAFLPSGKGIIPKEKAWALNGKLSFGNAYGAWREIISYDTQINTNGITSRKGFLREARRVMLWAVGLTWNDSPHELMGGDGYLTSLNEFGPGDIQGMIALGKNQGCIN